MITAETKDKVLLSIIGYSPEGKPIYTETSIILESLGIDFHTYKFILDYFQRIGFVEIILLTTHVTSLEVRVEAHDYVTRGGFKLQEEVFKTNLEKLEFEIENLKKKIEPQYLEDASKIATIIQTVMSGLASLPRFDK